MTYQKILCGLAAVTLTACGGGSAVSHAISLSDLENRIDGMNPAVFEDPTADADLPAAGSANYSGFAVVVLTDGVDTEFEALGSATMTADFGRQQVTGAADSFYQNDTPGSSASGDFDGSAIDGSLAFNLSQDVPGENLYVGTVSGSISPTDRSGISVNDEIGGIFTGADAEGFVAVGGEDEFGIAIFTTRD